MDSEGALSTPSTAGGGKRYATAEATKFELIGPGMATITRGAPGVLAVTAPSSDQEHLQVKLDADSMKVSYQGGMLRNRGPEGPIRYEITVPILAELKLSGGVAAEATNIDGRALKLELKDGSSLTLAQLAVAELDVKVDGGSRLTASGTVARQKSKLADKSIYQGGGLESEEVEIEAAGGSEATVRVSKKLKVKASAGSTVSYSGQHVDLDVHTSDGSQFRQTHG